MAEAKKTPAKAAKTAAKKTVAKKTATKTAAKAPAKKTAAKKAAPTHAEISALAHKFWVEGGHKHGHQAHDWARAEKELLG